MTSKKLRLSPEDLKAAIAERKSNQQRDRLKSTADSSNRSELLVFLLKRARCGLQGDHTLQRVAIAWLGREDCCLQDGLALPISLEREQLIESSDAAAVYDALFANDFHPSINFDDKTTMYVLHANRT